MDKTIQALKDSIKHWENLRNGTETGHSDNECALCGLFYDYGCVDCPIWKKTGEKYCRETPYVQYWKNNTPENAQKEIDFLKDLLIETLESTTGVIVRSEEKKEPQFKIGDIVKSDYEGMGIVRGIDTINNDEVGVEFFEMTSGHVLGTLNLGDGVVQKGHGWFVNPWNLELVYRPNNAE